MFKQKYCNMKYKLNEQQLNNIITNSTLKVLSEAMEDEGLGRFLGDMAGRIRNGINKFTGDFNAARNNRMYQNRNYDSYQNYGYDHNSRNFDTNTARQYKDAKNAGASRASMGSYSTQYGDTVPGAQPQENPQVAPKNTQQTEQPSASQNGPQNNPQMMNQTKVDKNSAGGGNQSIDQAAIAKAHGATRKPNRTVPTKQKAADGGQNNKAYDYMSDEDLANSGMLSGGKPMIPKTTARKSYTPNQTFTQDSYNKMKAKGQERESRQPRKPRISEAKLNQIVSESIRNVLKEANNGVVTLGNPEDGRGYHVTIAGDSLGPYAEFDVYGVGTDAQAAVDYAVDYLEKNGETGYFWDDDETAEEYPDDFFYAGNCGHILRSDLVHINQIG